MTKIRSDRIINILRAQPRIGAAALRTQLGDISRATLSRAIKQLGNNIISGGGSKRTRYALRRTLRGDAQPIPVYRIDENGQGHEIGRLTLTHPEGCHLTPTMLFRWPLDQDMADGWFDGLPYPIIDMRPQGFLGKRFAKTYAHNLQIADNPDNWSDNDTLYALSNLGHDQPGDMIIGDTAYRLFLDNISMPSSPPIADDEISLRYPQLANLAMTSGIAGSSAGGEFPKFTAHRYNQQQTRHVIVKFSAADNSAAVQRWTDLLVCEHIAAQILNDTLKIAAVSSTIFQHAGRTFLEITRFDRHGDYGRSPVCTLASINAALIGKNTEWPNSARTLQTLGWLASDDVTRITLAWWFGKLIANTDMHDGNLAFVPGLMLAPIYDMLPMMYAPANSGEVPAPAYQPALPLPAEQQLWQQAAAAATHYWRRCAQDSRISTDFRAICQKNCDTLTILLSKIKPII
jgi:hypothetical protein